MANDPVLDATTSAREALANADKFTHSVIGNSANAFAPPPAPHAMPSHIGGIPSYHMAHTVRKASDAADQEAKSLGEGLKARMEQNKVAEQ